MMAIGDDIRTRRKSLNLGLRELGRMAMVSAPYLSDIERGYRSPPPETLERICASLAMDCEPLMLAWARERLGRTPTGRVLLARLEEG
jgi:transcriptional regulator with XRE-family HTH domain